MMNTLQHCGPAARARSTSDRGPLPADRPTAESLRSGFNFSRILTVLVVLTVTVGLGAFAGTAPAAAHAGGNGCTGVPDSGYGFSFHNICDSHDRCYSNKPYGSTSLGRLRCDRVFRSSMLGYCSRYRSFSGAGISCRTVAWTYYYGVRALGYWSFSRSVSPPLG